MAIKIKPSHKGLLHKNLGVPAGKKIPASKLAIKSTDSTAVKKRKQFAINAKKWHHGQDGTQLLPYQEKLDLTTLPGNTVPQLNLPHDLRQPPPPNPKRPGAQINWGKEALTSLLAIDSAIPHQPINRWPAQRPLMSYNPNPQGTGSQAIAEDGIQLSTEGYKSTSPDKGKKKLRIPSNKITMKGVPHPVIGTDSLGNTQFMQPGEDYTFPGTYVDEIPMAKDGHWIQGAVNPKHKGYCTPMTKSTCTPRRKAFAMTMKKHHGFHEDGGTMSYQQGGSVQTAQPSTPIQQIQPLNPQEIDYFNGFIDYVKQKGLQGSPKLNTGNLNEQLYSEYQKLNPSLNTPLKDLTMRAQYAQHQGKEFDVNFAQRHDPNKADSLSKASISPIEGWFGSETSKRMIPKTLQVDVNNKSNVIRDLGYTTNPLGNVSKPIPRGAKIQKMADGDYYEDPTSGDLVKVQKYGGTTKYRKYGGTEQYDMEKMPPGYHLDGPVIMLDGALASGGTLSPDKAKEMLRDGTAHGHKLTPKQKRYFGMIAGGGNPQNAENGLTILDEDTVKFTGDKHSDASGGIPIAYGGKNVMVEGDETGYVSPEDNSLTIMGNMKNPLTNRKFKSDSKILAEKERKMNELMDYASPLLETSDPYSKWGALKFNAGNAMMVGAQKKKQEIQGSKEHLKDVQQAMLDTANEMGIKPQDLSNAKFGKKLPFAQRGMQAIYPRQFNTNTAPPRSLEDEMRTYQSNIQQGKPITNLLKNPEFLQEAMTNHLPIMQDGGSLSRRPRGVNPADWQYDEQLGTWHRKDSSAPTQSLALRHNNPGNLMYADWESKFGAEKGEPRYDKSGKIIGYFAKFPDIQHGQEAMKNLLTGPGYSNLSVEEASKKWTGEGAYKNIPPEIAKAKIKDLSPEQLTQALNTFTLREDSKKYNWANISNPTPQTPFEAGRVNYNPSPDTPMQPLQRPQTPQTNFQFNNPAPYSLPTNAQPLEFSQILPEVYAAATNKEQPVFLQKFQPQLYQPYNVSFQDRLNQNQATFSAASKAAAYNPSAISTLAGQKYSADSATLADEFRTNQGIANDITNRNISLLNEADMKNLQLADTQFVRQSQAKSNTKAINQDVLNSISSKLLQNEANNRRLQTYENLYRFRFDPNNNFQAYNAGPGGAEYVDWQGDPSMQGAGANSATRIRRDAQGNVKWSTEAVPSPTKTAIDYERLNEYKQKNVNQLLNMRNKGIKPGIDLYTPYTP